MAITVMQRYEMKYLLDSGQTDYLRRMIKSRMQIDRFGVTSIASLYYDTPDSRLIRASLEKPDFKEKIRLRSYGLASEDSPVFLELKRKCCDIVYKRRVQSTVSDVSRFFSGEGSPDGDAQIQKELSFFRDQYRTLIPACLVIYDRAAYFAPGTDLRLTIDACPRYRTEALSLTDSMFGQPLLDNGWTILEIKVQDAIPLWLSRILSEGGIFKSSFSKYGEAYRQELLKTADNAVLFTSQGLLSAA